MINEPNNQKSANITIKSPLDAKMQAEEFFSSVGLNMSSGINLYLAQVAHEKRIPFNIEKKDKPPIPVELIYYKENSFTYHLANIICHTVSNIELSALIQTYVLDNELLRNNPADVIDQAKVKGFNFSVVPNGSRVKISIGNLRDIGDWGERVISKVEYATENNYDRFKNVPLKEVFHLQLYYGFKDGKFEYQKVAVSDTRVFGTDGLAEYILNQIKKKYDSKDIIREIVEDAIKTAQLSPEQLEYYKKNGLIVTLVTDGLGNLEEIKCICDHNKNLESYEDCKIIETMLEEMLKEIDNM